MACHGLFLLTLEPFQLFPIPLSFPLSFSSISLFYLLAPLLCPSCAFLCTGSAPLAGPFITTCGCMDTQGPVRFHIWARLSTSIRSIIPVSDYSCLLLHLTALRFVPSLSVLIGWCFVVPPLVIFLVVIERVTLSRHAQSYGGCRLFSGAFTQARWSPSVRSRSVMSHGGGYKGRLSQRHIAGSRGTATFIFLYQVCPISIFKSRFFSE